MTFVSESKIEHIAQKLDDLSRLVQRLDTSPHQKRTGLREKNIESHETGKSLQISQSSGTHHEGIDTSLLVNALEVASFLETVLAQRDNGLESRVTADIRLSHQTLQAVLDSQGRHSSLSEDLPFPRSLLPGMTLKDLPIPSMENVMACMRMLQGTFVVKWVSIILL